MTFVKIHDPKKRGDYLVIARAAFDPSRHRLFEAEPDGIVPAAVAGPTADAPASEPAIAELEPDAPKRKGRKA